MRQDAEVVMKSTRNRRKSLKEILSKDFIKQIMFIAVPIMFQQVLMTSFGLVDSFMVSKIDNNISISAVGLCASIEMILNCIFFGIGTGTAIFASQYFGAKQKNGLQKCFYLILTTNLMVGLFACLGISVLNKEILQLYTESNDADNILILEAAIKYIKVACFAYIFSSINQCFMISYRTIKKSYIPLFIGIIALVINFSCNLLLINGYLTFPKLGVVGAAYGTLISSIVTTIVYFVVSIVIKPDFFGPLSRIKEAYQKDFYKMVASKTLPLVLNEVLYGIGLSLYTKLLLHTGTYQNSSYVMADKVAMLFFNTTFGINNACSVILGAELGKNNIEKAKDYRKGFLFIAGVYGLMVLSVMCIFGPSLLKIYDKPTPLAEILLYLYSVKVMLRAINVINLSTLRIGGDTKFLFILDGGIQWGVGLLLGFVLVYGLDVKNAILIFSVMQIEQLVRLVIGFLRIAKDKWAKNLINKQPAEELQEIV